jgi:hypothetical protein
MLKLLDNIVVFMDIFSGNGVGNVSIYKRLSIIFIRLEIRISFLKIINFILFGRCK